MNFSKIPSPCFVLEEKKLHNNLKILAQIRAKTGVQIILALKGFAFWAAFPMVKKYLNGATASSLSEAKLCSEELKCLAHTYAVAYTPTDFAEIMKLSSHISFNSLSEFEKYYPSVLGFEKRKISCGLRMNPSFSVIENPKNDPCQSGSRLGIDLEKIKNGLPIGIEGIHVHCLSESSAATTAQLLAVLEQKLKPFLPQLKWLNIGGGHHLTEANYDQKRLIKTLKIYFLEILGDLLAV